LFHSTLTYLSDRVHFIFVKLYLVLHFCQPDLATMYQATPVFNGLFPDEPVNLVSPSFFFHLFWKRTFRISGCLKARRLSCRPTNSVKALKESQLMELNQVWLHPLSFTTKLLRKGILLPLCWLH